MQDEYAPTGFVAATGTGAGYGRCGEAGKRLDRAVRHR